MLINPEVSLSYRHFITIMLKKTPFWLEFLISKVSEKTTEANFTRVSDLVFVSLVFFFHIIYSEWYQDSIWHAQQNNTYSCGNQLLLLVLSYQFFIVVTRHIPERGLHLRTVQVTNSAGRTGTGQIRSCVSIFIELMEVVEQKWAIRLENELYPAIIRIVSFL